MDYVAFCKTYIVREGEFMKHITFIDTEVSEADQKAYDFGAVTENDGKLHTGSAHEFHSFIADSEYLCGHNIINHDAKYIEVPDNAKLIDTLYLSPMLFPNKPYHISNASIITWWCLETI